LQERSVRVLGIFAELGGLVKKHDAVEQSIDKVANVKDYQHGFGKATNYGKEEYSFQSVQEGSDSQQTQTQTGKKA
jgi:hypothetical protein